jgi:thiamine transport system permease protein
MIKEIWRFRSSVLPGSIVSIFLIFLAVSLFFVLFVVSSDNVFLDIYIDKRVFGLVKFTIFQAFVSTLLSVLLGTCLAWSLAHQAKFRGRTQLVALFSSSLVLPTLIVVFGIISIYGRNGWINKAMMYLFDYSFGNYIYGLGGILIAHVYLNASFSARSLLHVFESIPKEKYKLAKSLNFSFWQRFIYIEWPAIKSSLKSISATIFLLCFTSFAIVLTLGGLPIYNTLEVAIYEAVKLDFDIPLALKLASIQLVITVFLVSLSSNFKSISLNLKTSSNTIPWEEKNGLKIVQYFVIIVFGLFFITPLVAVFVDGLNADFYKLFSDSLFRKSFFISISIATVSSLLTIILALFLSDARRNFNLDYRFKKSKLRSFLNFFIAFSGNLYLAIPSLILGLGFFLFSRMIEVSLNFWAIAALLSANVLMSLPFALSVLTPSMLKIAQRYDKLIFSLDLNQINRWIYCEFPYLKSSIGYVFALSFCLSLGDLGVISLFGNKDITTLPWYLYQLMGSYKTNDAAGVALILLVLTLSAFTLLPKLFKIGTGIAKNN